MNKIKFLSNIVLNSYRNYNQITNNEVMRKCNSKLFSVDNQTKRLISFSKPISETNGKSLKSDYQSDRDRSVVISADQSRQYMKSTAFRETYGHHKVWQLFRRNFKGQYSPMRPRDSCLVNNWVYTSNPCPICRDQYLVLDYSNLELLLHFINPHSGYVYENTILCLCSEQYEKLLVAITLAKDYGVLCFEVPVRTYDYSQYFPHQCKHQ